LLLGVESAFSLLAGATLALLGALAVCVKGALARKGREKHSNVNKRSPHPSEHRWSLETKEGGFIYSRKLILILLVLPLILVLLMIHHVSVRVDRGLARERSRGSSVGREQGEKTSKAFK
jgi:hypothetical protein